MKKYLPLVIVIGIVVAAIVILQNNLTQDGEENLGIIQPIEGEIGFGLGQIAPDFALKDSNGNVVKLSDHRGKVVLVNFWASWCPFCVEEMPDIQNAAKQFDNVVVLFVNRGENQQTGLSYINNELPVKIDYPVLWDTSESVSKKYILFGMPVSYFIDENGVIKDRKFGPMDFEEIQTRIKNVIGG